MALLIFLGCQQQDQQPAEKTGQDSIAVLPQKKIVVQEPEIPLKQFEDTYEDIELSRSTAITKAVAKVSPAVVSVSAVKIEQRRVYVDPFFQRFF